MPTARDAIDQTLTLCGITVRHRSDEVPGGLVETAQRNVELRLEPGFEPVREAAWRALRAHSVRLSEV